MLLEDMQRKDEINKLISVTEKSMQAFILSRGVNLTMIKTVCYYYDIMQNKKNQSK